MENQLGITAITTFKGPPFEIHFGQPSLTFSRFYRLETMLSKQELVDDTADLNNSIIFRDSKNAGWWELNCFVRPVWWCWSKWQKFDYKVDILKRLEKWTRSEKREHKPCQVFSNLSWSLLPRSSSPREVWKLWAEYANGYVWRKGTEDHKIKEKSNSCLV